MCSIWKLGDRSQELTLAQIKNLADNLKPMGVVVISLGGGEPFLREDLKEIIKIFIRKGFLVRLLTNGTLIKEADIRDLVSLGLRNVSVSLDTLSAKKQSYICKQEGVWDKIIDSIVLISKLFPKRQSLLLINTTVSRLNLEELPSLAKFAGKLGYHISYIPLEPIAVGPCGFYSNDYSPEFKITAEDYRIVDRIYDELIRMKERGNNIFNSTRFLENSRQFFKTSQINWQCDAGKLYLSINPQGNFSACHRFHSDGEYFNSNLGCLIKSHDFRLKWEKLIKDCPGCMRPCWAEISLMMKDWKSFWQMIKIEISTWRRRRFDPSQALNQRTKNLCNEDIACKSAN
jgi:MoaA/NifB/PqqE/SkfB family radical SAM enzyme